MQRKIIHIDMDAFYASVEQRDFPEYRDKPIVVGGSPTGRGVVATASYEARRFGIRSAMSSKKALELCPEVLFVRPRFEVYKEVSGAIRDIFRRFTDIVEPLSLDEAFLDVTYDKAGIGSALEIASQIRRAIWEELQLTASAGVSVNKFVAKIASDMQKPDGLTFIGPSRIESFMEQLPVSKFFGVGKVTAGKMKKLGLHTGGDLKKLREDELVRLFGKTGRFYYRIVRGIDERPVQPVRKAKSVSIEDTFPRDLDRHEQLIVELARQAGKLALRLENHQLKGKTLTLKLRFSDFSQLTRSRSFPEPFADRDNIEKRGIDLLENVNIRGRPVRLLGLGLSNFYRPPSDEDESDPDIQLKLF